MIIATDQWNCCWWVFFCDILHFINTLWSAWIMQKYDFSKFVLYGL